MWDAPWSQFPARYNARVLVLSRQLFGMELERLLEELLGISHVAVILGCAQRQVNDEEHDEGHDEGHERWIAG